MFRSIASLAYGLALFFLAKAQFLPGLAHDYLFGAISFLYIWVLLSAREASNASWSVHWTRQAARFSYSLYVIHMPLLLLITAFVVGDRLWSPTHVSTDAIAFAVLVLLVATSYAFGRLTEFRTDKVRRWLELR